MDGVNNAFCMSKEEYELARLTTKCAGLQGVIKTQAADIAKYKALCNQLGEALDWHYGQYADPESLKALKAWKAMK